MFLWKGARIPVDTEISHMVVCRAMLSKRDQKVVGLNPKVQLGDFFVGNLS